jgi:hypothetical protein
MQGGTQPLRLRSYLGSILEEKADGVMVALERCRNQSGKATYHHRIYFPTILEEKADDVVMAFR